MAKLSCNIHAQGLTRNVLQADKEDYDNHYKTMASKSRASLPTLLQIYVVKMRIFDNIITIQGCSVANIFHLQTQSGQDLFKAGYG